LASKLTELLNIVNKLPVVLLIFFIHIN
jgi:hypothetical protein